MVKSGRREDRKIWKVNRRLVSDVGKGSFQTYGCRQCSGDATELSNEIVVI
jgi:hypothetical protein